MSRRYRIDCTNCGWVGYRRPHPLNECACYDEYAWYCRPNSPGPGCPNGANLFALCPRCRNVRVTIEHNSPVAHFDRGTILVRETRRPRISEARARALADAARQNRVKRRRERAARADITAVTG